MAETTQATAEPVVGQTILPSIFEKATRMKLRFDTPRGLLTVEDVWDLPLVDTGRSLAGNNARVSLDTLAMGLNKQLKDSPTESFVVKNKKPNERLELQFAIVKHVIDVKLEEADAAEKAATRKQTKERIMAILAEKQVEGLKNKSEDELKALLETM